MSPVDAIDPSPMPLQLSGLAGLREPINQSQGKVTLDEA